MPLSNLRAAALVATATLIATSGAFAQCADGTRPPCRQPIRPALATAKPTPIDPNRVAVLPFRITTADSLLGEGFAELLAQEFTGEGGPRSVDMATTLRSWRHIGGGLRSPLAQDSAMILARQLGAGVLCQGTIVGLGGRLSVTASLISSSSAAPIGAPARVSGSADSVESLLRQVAASLLGVGANDRVLKSARLSKSPAALRSYLEGLALWRRGLTVAAARAFEASVAADSLFASASYQRWLMGQAYSGGGVVSADWGPRTRARVDLLTPRERTVFLAYAGPGTPRTRMQIYRDRRRAAEELGDSPEAWFFVGDYVFHFGNAVVGPDSVIPLSRQFFSLAVGLDTQPVFLFHLSELAVNTGDTTLMRRLVSVYNLVEGEEHWIHLWVLAAALRDESLLERLRRQGPPKQWTNVTFLAVAAHMDSPIPVGAFEEVSTLMSASGPKQVLDGITMTIEVARGRLVSAGVARPASPGADLAPIVLGMTGDAVDTLLTKALGPNVLPDAPFEGARRCMLARGTINRGERVSLDTAAIIPLRCRIALRALDAFKRGAITDSAVAQLDSLVTVGNVNNFMGFEHRVLADIYEARGDTVHALRAIQYYPRDYGGVWSAPTQREAGRLFLLAKDTARAITAYEHYLALRTEAQPPLVAERDSVKAIVSRLKTRFTP